MILRADIFAVSKNDSFDDIIQQMRTANHSRVPVSDTLDDAVGIIHIKDCCPFTGWQQPTYRSMVTSSIIHLPAIRLLDLLHEMRCGDVI